MRSISSFALALLLAPTIHAQTPVRGELAAVVGSATGTGSVASVGLPSVDDDGEAAFTGTLVSDDDTTGFVFFDGAVRWRNSEGGPAALVGREPWMGVGNDGQFVYSTTAGGEDALWTNLGLLLRRGDPAPDLPGQFVSYASRPGMLPDGTAYWISGVSSTTEGPTIFRAFYVGPDRATATVAIAEGHPLGDATVTALDLSYGLSRDGAHRAFIVTRGTGSAATDGAVALDGAVLAQEGSPVAGGAELWSAFDLVRVNAAAHTLVSGDTNGPAGADEVVVYNGQVALREGATVDGVTLGTDVRGLALNDAGVVVWAWSTSASAEEALFAGQAPDLAGSSRLVLRTGQGLDTSGDGVADYTVADFEFASGDGHGALDLGPAPVIYVRLDLIPAAGGPSRHSIVGLDLTRFFSAGEAGEGIPSGATLNVAPNPSGGAAAVSLVLDWPVEAATVAVFDELGRRVSVLYTGALGAGAHAFALPPALPPSVYVVRASGGGLALSRTVTVVR